MMIVGYISFIMSVLIIICFVAYQFGYDAGYRKATKHVRVRFKERETKS